MEQCILSFKLRIDPGGLPFSKYTIFKRAENSVNQVDGWENAIRAGTINIRPTANFPTEVFTVLSLTISVSKVIYDLIKAIQKERKEKEAFEAEKIEKYLAQQKNKLSIEEINAIHQLIQQLESLKEKMNEYGAIEISIDDIS